jgi:hypothetical protein
MLVLALLLMQLVAIRITARLIQTIRSVHHLRMDALHIKHSTRTPDTLTPQTAACNITHKITPACLTRQSPTASTSCS